MNKEITVIIPALNEEKTIGGIVEKVRGFIPRVFVGNDGSSDNTKYAAQTAGAEVISHSRQKGKGRMIKTLLTHILEEEDFETIIIMDGDGQHEPDDLTAFIAEYKRHHPDAIFGERKNFYNLPVLKKIWNIFISLLLSVLVRKRWRDTQCGFRLFSREAAKMLMPESRGYEVETEMFFKAHWLKFNIKKLDIKSELPYGKLVKSIDSSDHPTTSLRGSETTEAISRSRINTGLLRSLRSLAITTKDLWRAVKIMNFIAYELTIHAFKKIKKYWPVMALLILAAGIIFQAVTILNQKTKLFFFPGRGEVYGKEIETAMRWLKEHSDKNDAILAQWYWGHQIVAYAKRPVIASSKVYPSEVKEVGKRYIDIADFFFTTDEKRAKKIIDAYNAKFVFVEKNFQAQSCLNVKKCYFVNDKKLNRAGLKYTMAGKMVRGVEFDFAKPVFDSPNFIIYKITEKTEELVQNEKNTLLKFARLHLYAYLDSSPPPPTSEFLDSANERFLKPVTLDVSIWTNGQIRGSTIASGQNLPEAVMTAVSGLPKNPRFRALSKKDLDQSRIEIVVFKDDYAPLNVYQIKKDKNFAGINPLKGLRLTANNINGEYGYLLPGAFNTLNVSDNLDFLAHLCQKINLHQICFYIQGNSIETFSVEDFIEERPGGDALTMVGTAVQNHPPFTKAELAKSIKAAVNWTLNIQKPDGDFAGITYIHTTNAKMKDLVRGAISAVTLVEFDRISNLYNIQKLKNSRYLEAAKNHARFALKTLSDEKFDPKNSLTPGFMMLENLSLWETTEEKEYLDNAVILRKKMSPVTGSSTILVSAANAFMLAKFYQASHDLLSLEEAKNIMKDLMKRFPENRIWGREQSLGGNAWIINASRALYSATKKREYADFGLMIAQWLLEYQHPADEKWTTGAFPDTTQDNFIYVRGSSKAGEGLVDAYWLAKETGQNPEPFLEALKESMSWLMHMQYDENNSFFIPQERLMEFLGGFRHDYKTPEVWIDSAGHFLLAALGLMEIVENQ